MIALFRRKTWLYGKGILYSNYTALFKPFTSLIWDRGQYTNNRCDVRGLIAEKSLVMKNNNAIKILCALSVIGWVHPKFIMLLGATKQYTSINLHRIVPFGRQCSTLLNWRMYNRRGLVGTPTRAVPRRRCLHRPQAMRQFGMHPIECQTIFS